MSEFVIVRTIFTTTRTTVRKFSEHTLELTKDALSKCRVLSRESKTLQGKLKRYLILQPDPENLEELLKMEKEALASEIQDTWNESNKELKEIDERQESNQDART